MLFRNKKLAACAPRAALYFIDICGWTPNCTGRNREFAETAATA